MAETFLAKATNNRINELRQKDKFMKVKITMISFWKIYND